MRITCQKKFILDYLKRTKNHPSAKMVYSAIRKKLPRISLGTVYRNLKELKTKGQVQEIPLEPVRYDRDISYHTHFICRKCHRIFDVFNDVCRDCQIVKKKKTKVGQINSYKMNFYGICKNCQ